MTVRLNEVMSKRKHLLVALTVVALAAAVTALVLAAGDDDEGGAAVQPPDFEAALQGAPPELAAIHEQENELLPGGPEAFEARLEELRGFPIVVNKWASWCGPCRAEFPYFQSQAAKQGKRVAFLGVNSNDGEDSASEFLAEFPVPYPSYLDPDLEIADEIEGALAFPATAFYDSRGELVHVRNGPYSNGDELAADIERYAQ
jgi:cytochrome c biogenesis protein CcmG, thiol:disulfide interchange protein DsbE